MRTRARHAEIAGAGYAGLALAAALGRRGWKVRVHEQAASLREFGAGIYLWENGLRTLRALGCYERIMASSHEAPHYRVCSADGALVSEHTFGPAIGTRMVTMTRQTLYRGLFEVAREAGAEFRPGSRIVSAAASGTLTAENGATYAADLVVGADGVRSSVRETLGLTSSRLDLPQGAIRLLIPRPREETYDPSGQDVVTYMSGQGPRILCTPCDPENLYFAAITRTDDEARARVPLDKVAWTAIFPVLEDLFAQVGDRGRWDTYTVIKCRRWSAGRSALVGDACHGLPPTLGQGAGLAMMNALSLAVALDESDDVERALQHWEEAERPLTEDTQDRSLAMLGHMNRFASKDMNPWSDEALQAARHVPTGATA
jgi:2-polyprenyl-6-methoxyphenol hydroxylase-like FAD-dependent oxidoreductase